MAYTITQARPLLTAAELELFDQSRAEPIKALTPARLRSKVARVRTLRDKARDLFRRQTVSVRTAPTTQGRSPVGADNERTQRKAQVLQEVLDRYEARLALLESPGVAVPSGTATRAKEGAKDGMKDGTKDGAATAKVRAPALAPKGKSVTSPPSSDALAALAEPSQESVLNGHATRSVKAPSDKAPTANGKANAPLAHAPTDLVPSALRGNPPKQAPGNVAGSHAHQGASARRAQGKRDSR